MKKIIKQTLTTEVSERDDRADEYKVSPLAYVASFLILGPVGPVLLYGANELDKKIMGVEDEE